MRIVSFVITLGIAIGLAASAQSGELDRTFPAAAANTLTIALDFGSVAIQTHQSDQIRLEAVARGVGASSVHFDAQLEGGEVVLTGAAEPWVGWLQTAPGVHVKAWVPRDTAVRIRAPGPVEVERSGHPWVLVAP